jgi:hypothetical protein
VCLPFYLSRQSINSNWLSIAINFLIFFWEGYVKIYPKISTLWFLSFDSFLFSAFHRENNKTIKNNILVIKKKKKWKDDRKKLLHKHQKRERNVCFPSAQTTTTKVSIETLRKCQKNPERRLTHVKCCSESENHSSTKNVQ